MQLDPANIKTVLDIQNEALAHAKEDERSKRKGKRKASAMDADDSDVESDAMHLDAPLSGSDEDGGSEDDGEVMDVDAAPVPMPASGGIQALRDKLHARMAQLRNRGRGYGGGDWGEAGGRDELLEERRQQRAAMRERRRKETKEKIKREEERKGKGKGKEKEKQQQQKGPQTKVCRYPSLCVARSALLTVIPDTDSAPCTRR